MIIDCCGQNKGKGSNALAGFLRIISDGNRLKILCLLRSGDKCVCEIWKGLCLPQNLVSHHLKMLKKLDLITSRKDGLNVIYSLNKKTMKGYLDQINMILKQ